MSHNKNVFFLTWQMNVWFAYKMCCRARDHKNKRPSKCLTCADTRSLPGWFLKATASLLDWTNITLLLPTTVSLAVGVHCVITSGTRGCWWWQFSSVQSHSSLTHVTNPLHKSSIFSFSLSLLRVVYSFLILYWIAGWINRSYYN